MEGFQTWGEAVSLSLINLWQRLIDFFPSLLGSILILLAGWIIATVSGKLVEKFVQALRIDKILKKIDFDKKLFGEEAYTAISSFFGGVIRWFLILVFLMASADILGLSQVSNFLDSVLLYIPNVIVAVVILITVILVGNFVYKVIKGSTRAAGIMSATLLANISKWAIIVFGIFAALIQLGIASSLVNTIFFGIVSMLALAGGLAFGLGGREEAAIILKKIRKEISEKK